MLQFKLEVVFVSIGAEADFLDNYLGRVGLHLFGPLLLLIEILLIIKDLANGRIGFGSNLYQIKFHFLCQTKGGGKGIDAGVVDVVTNKSYLRSSNFLVDVELVLPLFFRLACRTSLCGPGTGGLESTVVWFVRRCDKKTSYKLKLLLIGEFLSHCALKPAAELFQGHRTLIYTL